MGTFTNPGFPDLMISFSNPASKEVAMSVIAQTLRFFNHHAHSSSWQYAPSFVPMLNNGQYVISSPVSDIFSPQKRDQRRFFSLTYRLQIISLSSSDTVA